MPAPTSHKRRPPSGGRATRAPLRRPCHNAGLAARHPRGSVLVGVLAIILLLSVLVTRFIGQAVEDMEYRAIFNEPAEVRAFAYGMLETTLATIREIAEIDDGRLHAPEQGWGDPLRYAGITPPEGWEVDIEVWDESGKLPLNTMPENLLNRLLEEEFDFGFGTARELSSTLLDWIDSDSNPRLNGAESDFYLRERPPYRAADAPLQSLDELRLIKAWDEEFFDSSGQPNERFQHLSEMVSVYRTGPVNLNSAPAPVIELLALENGWPARNIFDGLEKPYLTEPPGAGGSGNSSTEATLIGIRVTVQRGNAPFTIHALVEPDFGEGANSGGGPASGRSGNAPGRSEEDSARTGAVEEQEALNYPFTIRKLTEREGISRPPEPLRHSAIDNGAKNLSF